MAMCPRKRLIRLARYRSKKAGIECSIEVEDLEWPQSCPALNTELTYGAGGHGGDFNPSLDRIDPSGGYVSGNVRVISARANRIKNNASSEELLRIWLWMKAEEGTKDV